MDYVDYKYGLITLYPTIAYVFYLFCKKYYNYLLNNVMVDMYDNTYKYNKETQTDEILIAFNEIPT